MLFPGLIRAQTAQYHWPQIRFQFLHSRHLLVIGFIVVSFKVFACVVSQELRRLVERTPTHEKFAVYIFFDSGARMLAVLAQTRFFWPWLRFLLLGRHFPCCHHSKPLAVTNCPFLIRSYVSGLTWQGVTPKESAT